MTKRTITEWIPLFLLLFCISPIIIAPPASAQGLSCQGTDPSQYDVAGCCPKTPMTPISTACQPLIGRYNESLFIPLAHPEDKTIPARCSQFSKNKELRSRFNNLVGTNDDIGCALMELGDSPCDGKTRDDCCPKMVDKGTNACLWRTENGLCSGSTALAAAGNPFSTGQGKLYNATAENVCDTITVRPPPPMPYADMGTGSPTGGIGATKYAMDELFGTARYAHDPDVLRYIARQEESVIRNYALSVPGISDANAAGLGGLIPIPTPFVTAGQFVQQVAKQFQPSLPAGFGGGGGGGGGGAGSIMGMLGQIFNSFVGGFGFQIKQNISDIFGNAIGPNFFKGLESFSPQHIYDRAQQLIAVNTVPPFATYDPDSYPPGEELKRAIALAEKTPQQLAEAKQLNNPLVGDAYAFLQGSDVQGLVEKLLPFSHQFGSNDKVMKFLTSGEMSLGSFGLSFVSDMATKFPNPLSNILKPQQLIQDFKSTNFQQIFDPSNLFSPRDKLRIFPERDHYSQMMALPMSKVTKDFKKFGPWVPFHDKIKDAVRCSGSPQNVIRVDVLNQREADFTGHMMHRGYYDRWCKADPGGCCITCSCPPKPCPPWIPCWSQACWGEPIGAESPPCAIRHDPVHDKGFPIWCYHPRVKAAVQAWASSAGTEVRQVEPKHIVDVCHDLAAPLPIINKIPFGDVTQMASGGLQALEGTVFRQFFGNSRPFVRLDTMGAEHGQGGIGRPNLSMDMGANIGLLTGGMQNMFLQSAQKLLQDKLGGGMLPQNLNLPFSPGAIKQQIDKIIQDQVNGLLSQGTGLAPHLDNRIALVRSALAAGAPSGPAAGPGGQACLGGLGGETGGGCGSDGMHPFGSSVEMLSDQRRTAQWFGHACLPKYEKTFHMFSPEVMAMSSSAGNVQRIISSVPINSGGKSSGEQSQLRSVKMTLACRGHLLDDSNQFPNGGGCKAPKLEDGFDSLVELGDLAPGATILLPNGGVLSGEKPNLPNLALVERVGEDETGKYVAAWMTNIGTNPTRSGIRQDAGTTVLRYFRTDKLNPAAQREYDEMKSNAYADFQKSASCGNGPLKECLIDKQIKWVHFGVEDNKCQ